jgi:hypothetical protein
MGLSRLWRLLWGGAKAIANGNVLSVCVPLAWINPFFSSSRLIPTQSIGTIRLEMLFAPALEALITANGASYQIQNMNVVVDTFSLSDAALRSLQMIASQSGLAYEWTSVSPLPSVHLLFHPRFILYSPSIYSLFTLFRYTARSTPPMVRRLTSSP